MSATIPLLSVVVSAYNSQSRLGRVLATLVDYNGKVEVLIVNDGSKNDATRMTDEWTLRYPGIVRTIHQENKERGGAVNTGIGAASGTHVRVYDSDDWVDHPTMNHLLDLLRGERAAGRDLDLIVTDYVYEKQGKAHKTVVRCRNVLPQGKTVTWEEVKPCRCDQYMMMHSFAMHTEILRRSGFTLPGHTFYVSYLYSHTPLPLVRTIRYLGVDLYRYFIRHNDQSMNEKVMIPRLGQFLRVNHEIVAAIPKPEEVPVNPYRYMVHYLRINCVVTTVMIRLSGTPEHLEMKDQMWNGFEVTDPTTGAIVESDLLARLMCSRSRRFVTTAYSLVRAVMRFN